MARASSCRATPVRGRETLLRVEPRDRLGDPLHELADVARPGQDPRESLGRAGRVAEHPQEPGRVAQALADPTEGDEAVVGVDAVGEPPDHHRHEMPLDRRLPAQAARERADVAERAGGVAEPDGREAVVRLCRRKGLLVARQRRDRGQQGPVEEPHVDVADLPLHRLPELPHPVAGVGQPRGAREDAQPVRCRRHEVRAAEVAQLQRGARAPAAAGSRARTRPRPHGRCIPRSRGLPGHRASRAAGCARRRARARAAAAGP